MYTMHICNVLALAVVFALVVAEDQTGPSHGKKVVCPVWLQSDMDAKKISFDLDKTDWNLCTHVISVDQTGKDPLDSEDKWNDYEQLRGLRKKYPHLKISLGVRYTLSKHGQIVRNSNYQRKLISKNRNLEQILKYHDFVLSHNFSGLNLQIEDFESSKVSSERFSRFASFISALNGILQPVNLSTTLTVFTSQYINYTKYDFSELSKSVEFINFVHDYKTSMENYGINDAIKSLDISSTQEMIKKLIESRVSPIKIVLGVHFSGPGFYVLENNYEAKFYKMFAYNEVCGAKIWEKNQKLSKRLNHLSVFKKKVLAALTESSRSIANKVRLAMEYDLAGIAAVYIQQDDHKGICSIDKDTFENFVPIDGVILSIPKRSDAKFPLLCTINEAIDMSLDEIAQETNLTSSSSINTLTTENTTDPKPSLSTEESATISEATKASSTESHQMVTDFSQETAIESTSDSNSTIPSQSASNTTEQPSEETTHSTEWSEMEIGGPVLTPSPSFTLTTPPTTTPCATTAESTIVIETTESGEHSSSTPISSQDNGNGGVMNNAHSIMIFALVPIVFSFLISTK